MSKITLKDLLANYPARVELTERNLDIASQVVQELWNERQKERFIPRTPDRAGSCKFAALLARGLFGGRLAGNLDHVFVIQGDLIVDLNKDQPDVRELQALAHINIDSVIAHEEYREALDSCLPRVQKWLDLALSRVKAQDIKKSRSNDEPEISMAP